jgi:hypothetical protein
MTKRSAHFLGRETLPFESTTLVDVSFERKLRSFSLVWFFGISIFLDARSPAVIWRAALVLLLDPRGAAVSLIPVLFFLAKRIVFFLSGRRFLIVRVEGRMLFIGHPSGLLWLKVLANLIDEPQFIRVVALDIPSTGAFESGLWRPTLDRPAQRSVSSECCFALTLR